MLKPSLIAILLVSVLHCGPQNNNPRDVVCTTEFRYGLSITVTDAQTSAKICDATVVIRDGDYTETLMVVPFANASDCTFVGAGERSGSYTIDVTKTGFAAQTVAVTVKAGECHVVAEALTVDLQKE